MDGVTILEVGTGSGWFATYFEQHGALVTTTDIRGCCDFNAWGRPFYLDVRSEKAAPDRVLANWQPVYHSS